MGAATAERVLPGTLTVRQAAEQLGVPEKRLRNLQNRRAFEPVGHIKGDPARRRGEHLYRIEDIQRALASPTRAKRAELGIVGCHDRRVGITEAFELIGAKRGAIHNWVKMGLLPSARKVRNRMSFSLKELVAAKAQSDQCAGDLRSVVPPEGFVRIAEAAGQLGIRVDSLKNIAWKGSPEDYRRVRQSPVSHKYVWFISVEYVARKLAERATQARLMGAGEEYRPGEYPLPDCFQDSLPDGPVADAESRKPLPADMPRVIARDEWAVAELRRRREMFVGAGRRMSQRVFGQRRVA